LQHWCSLDVVLQIIKSLIKLMGLIAVVYILLLYSSFGVAGELRLDGGQPHIFL